MPRLNYERAASVLIDAAYWGDKAAASRAGVTVRTVEIWRARLRTDAQLSALFALKKERFEAGWADEVAAAIKAAVCYIRDAAQVIGKSDPDNLHAVAGALKILADVRFTKELLDARLAQQYREQREAAREMAARTILGGEPVRGGAVLGSAGGSADGGVQQ